MCAKAEGCSLAKKAEFGPSQEGPAQTSLAFQLSLLEAGAPVLGWEGGRNSRVPPGEVSGLFHATPGLLFGKRSQGQRRQPRDRAAPLD